LHGAQIQRANAEILSRLPALESPTSNAKAKAAAAQERWRAPRTEALSMMRSIGSRIQAHRAMRTAKRSFGSELKPAPSIPGTSGGKHFLLVPARIAERIEAERLPGESTLGTVLGLIQIEFLRSTRWPPASAAEAWDGYLAKELLYRMEREGDPRLRGIMEDRIGTATK
jgi:hypothetical protein